ncbi:hypothetical protein Ddc_14939 [Ditylenchus destructor]|nr:hypothetical protein Ddc_14939 [Ditylenchus destructor]
MTNFFQTALDIERAKLLMQQQKQAQSSPNVSNIWSQLSQASSIFSSPVTSKGVTSAQVPQATSSGNSGSRSQNSGSNLASSPAHGGLNLAQMGPNTTQLAQIRENKSIEDGFAEIRKRLEIQKQEFEQQRLRGIQKLPQQKNGDGHRK